MGKRWSPTVVIPSFNGILETSLWFILAVWVRRVFKTLEYRRANPPLRPASSPPAPAPKISVIVPARNEEKNIAQCLAHLFKQNYQDFEIIAVDDRSEDRTPHLLENFKKLSPAPFKIVRVEKLPPGWTGKNYAMFTGSRAAGGEWFLFTDADTTHGPESISTAVAAALDRRIDFLTLAPRTESVTFWEKTVQPLAIGSLALWFDPRKVNDPQSGVVLANGQFILVRRDVYEKAGGNEAVRNEVVEDVELARRVRSGGFTVQFLNGTALYKTRMYTSLEEIRTGWTRILIYLFNKKLPPIGRKIGLFLFFSILPFAALAAEAALGALGLAAYSGKILILSLGVSSLIVTVRFLGNQILKTNPWYAFLHPVGSLVMVWILLACAARIVLKRPSVWRGDSYH